MEQVGLDKEQKDMEQVGLDMEQTDQGKVQIDQDMEQAGLDKEVHRHLAPDMEAAVVEMGMEQCLAQLDMVAAVPVDMFVSQEGWV